MERIIPGLSHLVFIVLTAPPSVASTDLTIPRVVHVSNQRTWREAQHYCKNNHSDLVTVNNYEEVQQLALYKGWIGLHRDSANHWKWSREDQTFDLSKWDIGVLGAMGLRDYLTLLPRQTDEANEICVLQSGLKWEDEHCSHPHPFLCFDESLILVQEKKTWEEALLHCRELQAVGSTEEHTTHPYDLASLPEGSNALLDRDKIKQTVATNEVWVGLRFLAGDWLWMSRQEVTSSYLPRCSDKLQRCGALVPDNKEWKMMECTEKRNFLCSTKL